MCSASRSSSTRCRSSTLSTEFEQVPAGAQRVPWRTSCTALAGRPLTGLLLQQLREAEHRVQRRARSHGSCATGNGSSLGSASSAACLSRSAASARAALGDVDQRADDALRAAGSRRARTTLAAVVHPEPTARRGAHAVLGCCTVAVSPRRCASEPCLRRLDVVGMDPAPASRPDYRLPVVVQAEQRAPARRHVHVLAPRCPSPTRPGCSRRARTSSAVLGQRQPRALCSAASRNAISAVTSHAAPR